MRQVCPLYTTQDHVLDGSVANIAVTVECCELFSAASFYWSILYTRAASGVIFAEIVSLSQNRSKINLRCSQVAALSRYCFRCMRCANVRVSNPISFLLLQVLSYCQPIPAVWACLPWEGPTLLSPCLGRTCLFGLGCCCLFFDV